MRSQEASSGLVRARRAAPALALLAGLACALWAPPSTAQVSGAEIARIQSLEEDVRRLNGRIQELEARMRRIADDAALRINDLEYRLTELEGGDPTLVGDPVPLGQAPKPVQPPKDQGSGVAVARIGDDAAEIAAARDSLDAGDAVGAERRLSALLQSNPNGPLTAEAQYWLGMAQWQGGAARVAAQTFLATVSAYPDSPVAPDSLLMLGRSLERLSERREACLTFTEVKTRYPSTIAAADADLERARLDCE